MASRLADELTRMTVYGQEKFSAGYAAGLRAAAERLRGEALEALAVESDAVARGEWQTAQEYSGRAGVLSKMADALDTDALAAEQGKPND